MRRVTYEGGTGGGGGGVRGDQAMRRERCFDVSAFFVFVCGACCLSVLVLVLCPPVREYVTERSFYMTPLGRSDGKSTDE